MPRHLRWSRWAATLVLLALATAASAQERRIPFDHVGLQEGLPHSTVNAIVQDDLGFVWLGTQDGLVHWDGNAFTAYRHEPGNQGSLSNNWVWTILKDSTGRLWIGTNEGGLNLWEPATRSFVQYRNDEMDPASLSNNRVRALLEDRNGRIWVGTESGLNVFDPIAGRFDRYFHDPSNPDSLSHNQIRTIFQDRRGSIWVGTNGGGLDRLDDAGGVFTHFRHDPDDPASLSRDRVRVVFEDRSDQLWVGTYEGGLNRFDPATGAFTRFAEEPGRSGSLLGNRVTSIHQDSNGVLWVGTFSGLNEWLPERQAFTRYAHNPADPASLSDNRVMTIFQDRGGVLWVGTQGGISKWNAVTGSFSGFRHDPAAPDRSLISNTVNALAEDAQGRLWIGTYEGLDVLDRGTGTVTHHLRDDAVPGRLRDDRVMSLHVDRGGTLWVGTFEGGLHRRRADGRFRNYRHDPDDPASLSRDKVLALLEASDGALWVGTDGGGLSRLDRRQGTFTRYRSNSDAESSLGADTIFSLAESSDGTLWIGTQGGGLSRWLKQDRIANRVRFKTYTTSDGLPNDVVYAILEDESGSLWLSTNDGLARFDPATETFRKYGTTHGLLSTEFNFGAFLKTRDGEMLFGSDQGVNFFQPSRIHANDHAPPVVLTSFLKFNQEERLEIPTPELRELYLTHKDYVVSFEFAALDFSAPERNSYAYMLEGFDTGWNEVGNLNRATYTNLDPGRYTFRVKASNNDDLWNENGVALAINVAPPPWRAWWAYLAYLAAALAVLLAVVRRQSAIRVREIQQRRELEDQVALRTTELAERNQELESAIDRLEHASVTDALTGLRNRRYLVNNIDADLALVDRHHENLKRRPKVAAEGPPPDFLFLLFDLDGFKQVNDTYGHAAGDLILLQVTEILRGACRDADTVIRWGGDEFLIVARNATPKTAEDLAERIRAGIAGHRFELGPETSVELSCSIGFASYPFLRKFPRAFTWEQVVAVADRGLYFAKKSCRNAWAGISENHRVDTVHPSSLLHQINHELEQLVQLEVVELRTSIEDEAELVWGWT